MFEEAAVQEINILEDGEKKEVYQNVQHQILNNDTNSSIFNKSTTEETITKKSIKCSQQYAEMKVKVSLLFKDGKSAEDIGIGNIEVCRNFKTGLRTVGVKRKGNNIVHFDITPLQKISYQDAGKKKIIIKCLCKIRNEMEYSRNTVRLHFVTPDDSFYFEKDFNKIKEEEVKIDDNICNKEKTSENIETRFTLFEPLVVDNTCNI
uniref:RanBD1 domain-containing protein n=1 Tax=Rhabditophanes sp. KR3021 TaxID=114890 RepID=A0AC35U297_9BILA